MTVQNLYTQYLDGKITKQKFLYEVRRDQHLDMISSSNSFEDVVKILKNKSIISEKAHKEAKLATGKQEVDIIAKTIDMVNPYEYTRGMNYELEIMDIPASEGDLSEENILKAQKKVLANLTKNSQYYGEKMHGKGEVGHEWIEATKKEIDKIGKGKPKTIREGLEKVATNEDFPKWRELEDEEKERISKFVKDTGDRDQAEYDAAKKERMAAQSAALAKYINGDVNEAADTEADKAMVRKLMDMYEAEPSKFEKLYKQAQTQASTTSDIKFKHILSLLDRAKAGALQSLANQDKFEADREGMDEAARPGYHADGTPKSNDEMSDDEREAFYNDSDFLDEHGQYADRVADVNADSSPLKEKQEAIYKKYAESTGIPMENLMAMVREAKAKLQEADDTPEEKKAKDLEIAAEKAKIAASNKKIQDLNQGR